MGAFNSWTTKGRRWRFHYIKDLFSWTKGENNRYTGEIKEHPSQVPDGYQLKYELENGGYAHGIFLHCICGAIGGGPKILRLTNVDFDILEKIDLTIGIKDYHQPFETMIVEWPEGYSAAREIKNPREGAEDEYTGGIHGATHRPIFAMIRHNAEHDAIFITICLSSNDIYGTVIYTPETIEHELEAKFALEEYELSLPITQEERRVYKDVMRAALNACLYVNDFGHKREGPENPGHHRRLEHFVEVARKSKNSERIGKAQRELKSHPIIYTIAQDVRMKVKKDRQRTIEGTGRTVGPHWRRGHHRWQRYGKGLSEEKRIWIFPTQVNWDFFDGESKDTSVELHD